SSSAALATSQSPSGRRISASGSSDASSVAAVAMSSRPSLSICAAKGARDRPKLFNYAKSRYAATASAGRRAMDLKDHIRAIPDFPKPGILFYDISTLLAHPLAWRETVERLAAAVRPSRPDLLVGIESRGFLVSAPLAYTLGCGFAMVRKQGK